MNYVDPSTVVGIRRPVADRPGGWTESDARRPERLAGLAFALLSWRKTVFSAHGAIAFGV